ncbi:MAG: ATP-binding protein [Oscillospiraceae bacterium]|nr:ATP-binding protein [Oscillospiraceae bacterium]
MRSREELFREAQRRVAARRQRAVTQAQAMSLQAHAAIPALQRAEDEITRLGFERAQLAAKGASRETQQAAREQQQVAREQRSALLRANGYAPEMLDPAYICPECRDTGVKEGRVCGCVLQLSRQLRRDEINAASALSISSFDTMDTALYPDHFDPDYGMTVRAYMTETLEALREYAEHFDMRSSNLLITGNAGLGKTHAALAIAGVVLERGYDVIYVSAQELFAHLEKNRFEDEDTMMEAVLGADLLILDDLGTEYATSYMLSCFYTIVNTRLSAKRPTIYTSNIVDGTMFEKRYTEKIASRLGGSCEPIAFLGEDIRHLKNE